MLTLIAVQSPPTVVPTSFRRQRFRKDLNISVKGNNYALLKGFQTTYVFLLRALESVLVLGKSLREVNNLWSTDSLIYET